MMGGKYIMSETQLNEYSFYMNLTIKGLERKDLGGYVCASVNALGKVEGSVRLQGLFRFESLVILLCWCEGVIVCLFFLIFGEQNYNFRPRWPLFRWHRSRLDRLIRSLPTIGTKIEVGNRSTKADTIWRQGLGWTKSRQIPSTWITLERDPPGSPWTLDARQKPDWCFRWHYCRSSHIGLIFKVIDSPNICLGKFRFL